MKKAYNPSFWEVFGGDSMSKEDAAKLTVRSIMREVNPVGKGRRHIDVDREHRRTRQVASAQHFLTTGQQDGEKPPYGNEWDYDYNPMPYPEARPPLEEYAGTGIGQIYQLLLFDDEGEPYLPFDEGVAIAGKRVVRTVGEWRLVATGAEVRARRKW